MADHLRRMRVYERDLGVERVFRDRSNPIELYNDEEFKCRFRLRKDSVTTIIDLVEMELQRPTYRNHAVPPVLQVCACLRFLATGAFHQLVGDTALGLSRPAVCRAVFAVTTALCRLAPTYIQFPVGEDAARVKRGFYARHGKFVWYVFT